MLRRALPDGCLSSLALDEHAVGQLEPARRDAVRAHLVDCPHCGARAKALEAERIRFAARERGRRRAAPTGVVRPAIAVGFGLLVAAAAVLLLVDRRDPGSPPGDTTRAKGGLRLEVYVKKGDQVLPARGAVLRPGDAIRFAVAGVDGGYLAVLGRDGTGRVSVYYPPGERAAPASRAEEEEALPGSIVLDDAPGPETIALVHCDAAVPVATLAAVLARGGDAPVPGCAVDRLELEKGP